MSHTKISDLNTIVTIADDDLIPIVAASEVETKHSLWSLINSTLKTYFDSIYPTKTTTDTLTLVAADWSTNEQAITVTGVTSTSTNIIQIDSITMGDRWGAAKIYATDQDTNEITFTCDEEPTEDIEFKVVIIK